MPVYDPHHHPLPTTTPVDFLVLEKYEEIVRYLKDSPAAMRRWNLRGPALQWNYLEWSGEGPGAGEEDTAPSPIDGLVALLVSAPFVEWLSAVTGLSLVKAHAEARRFSRHHYTLLFDGAPCYEGLDAFLNLSPGDWDPEAGGVTSYVYDKGAAHVCVCVCVCVCACACAYMRLSGYVFPLCRPNLLSRCASLTACMSPPPFRPPTTAF